jgi:hypothetical protein
MPVTITISSGTEANGLIIKDKLVSIYNLDIEKIREHIKSSMSSSLFDSAVTAQMIQDNIEEID